MEALRFESPSADRKSADSLDYRNGPPEFKGSGSNVDISAITDLKKLFRGLVIAANGNKDIDSAADAFWNRANTIIPHLSVYARHSATADESAGIHRIVASALHALFLCGLNNGIGFCGSTDPSIPVVSAAITPGTWKRDEYLGFVYWIVSARFVEAPPHATWQTEGNIGFIDYNRLLADGIAPHRELLSGPMTNEPLMNAAKQLARELKIDRSRYCQLCQVERADFEATRQLKDQMFVHKTLNTPMWLLPDLSETCSALLQPRSTLHGYLASAAKEPEMTRLMLRLAINHLLASTASLIDETRARLEDNGDQKLAYFAAIEKLAWSARIGASPGPSVQKVAWGMFTSGLADCNIRGLQGILDVCKGTDPAKSLLELLERVYAMDGIPEPDRIARFRS